jgi:hypothetical protein
LDPQETNIDSLLPTPGIASAGRSVLLRASGMIVYAPAQARAARLKQRSYRLLLHVMT